MLLAAVVCSFVFCRHNSVYFDRFIIVLFVFILILSLYYFSMRLGDPSFVNITEVLQMMMDKNTASLERSRIMPAETFAPRHTSVIALFVLSFFVVVTLFICFVGDYCAHLSCYRFRAQLL